MLRLIRLAFWAAVLFALFMAAIPRPPDLQIWDKWQHMAAFFVITVLGRTAYHRLTRKILLPALIGFGGLIELVQMIPALHRDSQLSDWVADIVAVIAALVIVSLVERLLGRPAH